MSYYVKETADTVKQQFALYYPAAMEWIADNIEHIENYYVTFPHETDDGKGGYTLAQYMMGAMVVGMASKDSIMDAISDIKDKVDMELSEDEIVEEN